MPLEIAHVRGKPLTTQGVSLVFEQPDAKPPPSAPIGDRLRLLAVFSLPPAGSPLNLRRERQMLRALVRRLSGSAIELRILQYGVTRESLRDALQDGDGWDLLHYSGHGLPGSLVLEKPDGRPDPILGSEVADLLRHSGRRLKLVVLSSCLSAALSIEQTLAWLSIETARGKAPRAGELAGGNGQTPEAAPTVARALVGALDCAVVAMRYAVEDEFAMAYARNIYDGLLRQGQSLPQATQNALGRALGEGGSAGALSMATPALFGVKAADLRLIPPKRPSRGFAVPETGLAFFPTERDHFVGRVAAMTRASAALASESEMSGVLFHGMAGAGKTSCAVELAYQHQAAGRFQAFVWYTAPNPDKDIQLALHDLALAMEKQLPGFTMVHVVDSVAELKAWLPRLIELLKENAVLVVLDKLESLLSGSGEWRDERWGMLIDALLAPGGLSRTVLTSRIRPASLSASTELVPVHALPLAEALLLVRELPNLRRLLDGKVPGVALDAGRLLMRRALRLVQGHPELIKLAEGLAAEPERLAAQLDRADVAEGGALDAFFSAGESRFDAVAFTASLRDWTTGIDAALPEAARTFFHFLCAIEESDRESWVIEANWADLLKRLGLPDPAPPVAEALAPLIAAGLVDRKRTDETGKQFELLIHPSVAEAGRAEAGPAFQEAVDAELASSWQLLMRVGLDSYGKEPGAGAMIVRAGLASFPYLSRRREWGKASAMLERAASLDSSPATLAAGLPRVRRIIEATAGTNEELSNRSLLARIFAQVGRPGEAEKELRALIEESKRQAEFRAASAAAGDLANLLRTSGRLDDALGVIEQAADYGRRAGLGAWTLLSREGQRLQIQLLRGEYDTVARRVSELREQMKAMPEQLGPNEFVNAWNVRELILDIGWSAALRLEEWQQALDFSAEILASEQGRGAPELEQAQTLFNNYGPLLTLHRYDEARAVLLACQATFERENSIAGVGRVLSARADLEDELGHMTEAKSLQEAALRFKYIEGDPDSIRISHFNLANYLLRGGDQQREALAHRLVAAMIAVDSSSDRARENLARLAADIRASGEAGRAALPADFDSLCKMVEQVEGVRFGDLMRRLAGDTAACDQLFQGVVEAAVEAASKTGEGQTE
jgi:tetratricopeptide (TPR) repeat protein